MTDKQQDQPRDQRGDEPAPAAAFLDDGLSDRDRQRLRAALDADPKARGELDEVLGYRRLVEHFSIASRAYCPGAEALATGARGGLDLRQPLFDQHLEACPLCADAVADFRALDAPRFCELALKLGRQALEVVHNSFGELFEPAPVPVFRGEGAAEPLGVERVFDDEARLAITLANDPSEGAAAELKAMLRVELERPEGPGAFSVLLFQDGQVIDGRSTRAGRVTIDDVPRGLYELVVTESAAPEGGAKVEETLDLDLR